MQLQRKARSGPSIAVREKTHTIRFGLGKPFPFRISFPPALLALLIQLAATLLTLAILVPVLELSGIHLGLLSWAFLQGGVALLISRYLDQASWWWGIHLFFVPALAWAQSFGIESAWFFAAFLLLFLVYWSVFRSQVPLYLSSRKAWDAIAELLPAKSGVCLIDLGAGLGGMLGYLSRKRPDGQFSGMEVAPLPFALAWLRKLLSRGTYQISWGNFWPHDLVAYDVVYAYLSPVPMTRIWQKVCAEMPSGSCFISNTFAVPGVLADKIIELDDFHHSKLYVYRIPAKPGNDKP